MMRWIVGSSLRFRLLVVPVAAAVLVIGIAQHAAARACSANTPVVTCPQAHRRRSARCSHTHNRTSGRSKT
jgi:hypothetical protein